MEHTTDELSFHITRDMREGTARTYPADSYYVQALEKVNKYLTIEDFSSAACELERQLTSKTSQQFRHPHPPRRPAPVAKKPLRSQA